VPQLEKFDVERGYRPPAKLYGSTLEIDHIASLELRGSENIASLELGRLKDIANLYPEKAILPAGAPRYHAKDKRENKLHDLGFDGTKRPAADCGELAGALQEGVREGAVAKLSVGVRRLGAWRTPKPGHVCRACSMSASRRQRR
jgi:hypothetical protein